mgnify:FL=1
MDIKTINSVKISQSNMSVVAQSRLLNIAGDIGASFIINVIKINGTGKESYYNFKTKAFTEAFIAANALRQTMGSSNFSIPISFPADASGDVYSIIVIPSKNTVLKNGSGVISKKITQVGQTTLVLEVDEGAEITSAFGDKYTTNPPDTNVSSVGSSVQSGSTNVSIAWTLTNKASDTHGFGFMLPDRLSSFVIPDSYWFTEQTQVVNGTISSSTTLVLDSVVNLIVGMTLSHTNSGSISGAPVITAINGNTLTLSVAQSLSDGVTLGFRAYGPTLISKVFGLNVAFNNFVAIGTELIKTVRSDTTFPESDGAVTVNLNGTYGIAGGNLVRIKGFNINENANNNLVVSVSASSTVGSVNVTFQGAATSDPEVEASVVPAGTKLYVNGSHQEIKITGTVVVNKYPETNAKLKLDLTKFITHGTSGL